MTVDLAKLPADEEWLRTGGRAPNSNSAQNVLDALNYYRCRAMFTHQESVRLMDAVVDLVDQVAQEAKDAKADLARVESGYAEEVSLSHGTIKAHGELLNRMHADRAGLAEVLRNITECAEAYYRKMHPDWAGDYFEDSVFGMAHAAIAKLDAKS